MLDLSRVIAKLGNPNNISVSHYDGTKARIILQYTDDSQSRISYHLDITYLYDYSDGSIKGHTSYVSYNDFS